MELYVKVSFCLGCIAMVFNLCEIINSEYPKVTNKTLGAKTAEMFIAAGFLFWSGSLLFS
jgi:hypothetical protein